MAGQTLLNADAALKDFYEPGSREQLNNEIPFLNQIERNSDDIEGRQAVLALHVQRNAGVGARGDGGTLPTAGAQGYTNEKVPLKYNYGRIQLSGPTIRAMRSDRGSFVRAVDSEMKGVTADLKREVSRQIWMNGDGKIATCGTTTATTVVQLAAATTVVQMRFFQVGDFVDIGTVAAPTTIVAASKITAVDTTNLTITISSAVTTSASHFVFRAGNNGVSLTNEVTGLQKLVAASGTLHNVDPTTYPVWASYVKTAVGSLNENLMAGVVQNVQIASGDYPNLIVGDDGSHRAYANLLTSLKRFPGTVALKGGYAGLDFTAGGPTIPVVWDRDCPFGSLFYLNTDHFTEYRMADWEFMQEDGHILFRVSGVDAYEATLFMYHELATDGRNQHGLQTGITTA